MEPKTRNKLGAPCSVHSPMRIGLRYVVFTAFACLIFAGQTEQCWAFGSEQSKKQHFNAPLSRPAAYHTASSRPAKTYCYPDSAPNVSCEGIAAKAAVDQAVDADQQTATAWWQFGVGVLTLGAAIAAALYARHSVLVSRRIGEAQTRAYLSVTSLEGQKIEGGMVFQATVQNSGQSPALSAQIMLRIVNENGDVINVLPEHEHYIPAQSSAALAYCYFRDSQAVAWPGIVVKTVIAYSDVFGSLDRVGDTFAGSPEDWYTNKFTQLTKGMHVASYLRAMQPE